MPQRRLLALSVLALFVAVLAPSVQARQGEKATLKWKFEPGKTFYQKMVTETKQKMTVGSNEVNQTQSQTFFFSWTVNKVEGDTVTLTQKIEGVIMKIDIGNQKIDYDSTKKQDQPGNPLSEFFKNMVASKGFEIVLNQKTMKVTDVKNRVEFLNDLVKANPQMRPLLETILSEESVKQMAEPTFAAIPGEEVTKGKSWPRESKLNMGPIGTYENKYDYTLNKIDKDIAEIAVKTTLTYTPPTADAAGVGGLPFRIKSADLKSSNANGTINFSTKEGRIVSSNLTLELSGDLSIEIGGQTTKVTLTQTQTSVVTNLAEKPPELTKTQ